MIALGGKDIIDPLIRATKDADPEVQIRATDGLVNYYLPGYVKQGLGSIAGAGRGVDQGEIQRYERSDHRSVCDRAARGDRGAGPAGARRIEPWMRAPTRAARSGFCADDAALPDLIDALRTKDNNVMYESLAAMQKIGDPSGGPEITYLLRDLDDRVQTTAIETAGLLRSTDALPALRGIVAKPRNNKAERAALAAIAMMPEDAGPRPVAAGVGGERRETAGGGGGRSGEDRKSRG